MDIWGIKASIPVDVEATSRGYDGDTCILGDSLVNDAPDTLPEAMKTKKMLHWPRERIQVLAILENAPCSSAPNLLFAIAEQEVDVPIYVRDRGNIVFQTIPTKTRFTREVQGPSSSLQEANCLAPILRCPKILAVVAITGVVVLR